MIRLRHLVKDTFVYGLVSAGRSLIGVLLVPIYTRIFLPADYGQLDTLTTMASLLMLGTTVGMDAAVQMYFYDNQGDQDRATMLSTAIAIRALLALFFATLVTLLSPLLSRQFFRDPGIASVISLAMWAVPANVLTGFFIDLLRLNRRVWRYSALAIANLMLGVLGSILFVVGLRWGVRGAFAGPLVANLLVLPFALWATRTHFAWRFSRRWLVSMLRVGLPLVPAGLGGWLIAYANRYFLLHFGSATDVGLLAVGNKVSAPLALVTSAFLIAWGPFAFSIQNQLNARDVYAKVLVYFLTVGGSLAVLIGLLARELLWLFTTPDYLAGYRISGLMCFQLVADTSYYIVAIGLILAKKTQYLAYSVLIAAVGSLILNLLLVPWLGFLGAALASMLSYALLAWVAWRFSQRAYKIPYPITKIALLLVWCLVIWAVGISISTRWLWLDLGIKLGLYGVFAAGLWGLRIVGSHEIMLLVEWLKQQWLALKQGRLPSFS